MILASLGNYTFLKLPLLLVMRILNFAATLFLFLFFNHSLYSQNIFKDSSVATSFNNAVKLYNAVLKDQTNLFMGAEYIEDHPGISGIPFWQYNTLRPGAIFYNGILYPMTRLAYDAVNEHVVVRNDQQLSIKLANERIKWFSIGSSYFVHLSKDSLKNADTEAGFYNLLVDGKLKAYAKRKRVSVRVLQPTDHYEYQEQDKFFVADSNRFLFAGNKSDVLKALSDRKDDIKKYIRSNRLDFKTDIETDIVSIVNYYNSIVK